MKKSLLITGVVVGILLALGPLWGMLGTILGMNHAFDTLAGNGVSDPQALSGAIGQTLMATMLGLVACPVGVVLLAICIVFLVRLNKQPPPLPAARLD
jgi:biopolymer transport protein ExbB/TolQ